MAVIKKSLFLAVVAVSMLVVFCWSLGATAAAVDVDADQNYLLKRGDVATYKCTETGTVAIYTYTSGAQAPTKSTTTKDIATAAGSTFTCDDVFNAHGQFATGAYKKDDAGVSYAAVHEAKPCALSTAPAPMQVFCEMTTSSSSSAFSSFATNQFIVFMVAFAGTLYASFVVNM